MSTLKSFQSEIQEIHARELARQRGRPPATTSLNVQGLEETNNAGEPPSSRGVGAEDEVEAVLVLHLTLSSSVFAHSFLRHYSLAMTMTAHVSPLLNLSLGAKVNIYSALALGLPIHHYLRERT